MSWFSDNRSVIAWAGPRLKYPLDYEQLLPFVGRKDRDLAAWRAWSIIDFTSRQVLGHFQLCFDRQRRSALLGRVAIDPALRGQGLGFALTKLATEKAFVGPWVERLQLRVFDFNLAAIAVYRKVGFVDDGTCGETLQVENELWSVLVMHIPRSK